MTAIYGSSQLASVCCEAVLADNGIEKEFSPQVLEEAKRVQEKGISQREIDRSTGKVVPPSGRHCGESSGEAVPASGWHYDESTGEVVIRTVPFHDYTVSFLAYIMWDPVHMYNAVVNDWKDVEHQITFDVRQPKTHAFTMERLRRFIQDHPYVNVLRFTTFFHQFTLVFDELAREKYVDWYGYSASEIGRAHV